MDEPILFSCLFYREITMDYKTNAEPRTVAPDGAAVFCRYDELVEVSELKPNPGNPNQHSDGQIELLAKIIKSTGWRAPITVSKRSGLITKGHGRRMAAMRAGLKYAPVEYQDYASEEEEHADLLADNRIAELANMDEDKLTAMLKEMQDMADDFDMDLTGYDEAALAELLEEEATADDTTDSDVPESEGPVFTKRGDLWFLGRHRLLCGDSTNAGEVETLMGGDQADLYLTDPPYNVAYVGKTKDALTIQNDKMADGDFRQFLVDAFSAADAVMKQGAAFYIWHADSEGFNFRGACDDIGWKVRECLIWNKNTMVLGRQDYQWKHEPCLYGWKDGASHNWYSDRSQTTVIDMDKPSRSADHPTMKPVPLFAYEIQNSTKPGDIVLDSFGGSGTTLIACEQMNRMARLMELDPKYCDVIIRRYLKEDGAAQPDVYVERDGRHMSLEEALEQAGAVL